MNLPASIDPYYFDDVYRLDSSQWIFAVEELCNEFNIPIRTYSFFNAGSNLIAGVNDETIIKIFPPFHRHQWVSEYKALSFFHNKLPVAIPDLLSYGVREDQWTYVILSRLKGVMLHEQWPGFDAETKLKLMKHLGTIMKTAHAVTVDQTISLEPYWEEFMRKQFHACYNRHLNFEMPEWFMGGLSAYIQNHFDLIPKAFTPVLLTGEYTPFNCLVQYVNEEWSFSGMIDFGDAMIGFHEYDLLGPILFLAGGNGTLIKALLESYGYDYVLEYPALRQRLMVLAILHRYSNFNFQLRIEDWKAKAKSFEELENLIFPFS